MVASTNRVRRALHEASLRSLKEQKKPLHTTKNAFCMMELARRHQGWTIHDWYKVNSDEESKIN